MRIGDRPIRRRGPEARTLRLEGPGGGGHAESGHTPSPQFRRRHRSIPRNEMVMFP